MKNLALAFLLSTALIAPLSTFTPTAHAEDVITIKKKSLADLYQENLPGVVMVVAANRKEGEHSGMGSGFFIADGLIVTNNHVKEGSGENSAIKVASSERLWKIKWIASDAMADLAIATVVDWKEFKETEQWKRLELAPSDDTHPGEAIWAIGAPYGFPWTVTEGVLSSNDRRLPFGVMPAPLIQTDTQVLPGNSGGPLFNDDGKVIGVNTLIVNMGAGSISFALTSEWVVRVVTDFKKMGKVMWGYLGINVATDRATGKVAIAKIGKDSLVALGGLEVGDVLEKVYTKLHPKGIELKKGADQLLNELWMLDVGDEVAFDITRKGVPYTALKTKMVPRPADKKIGDDDDNSKLPQKFGPRKKRAHPLLPRLPS